MAESPSRVLEGPLLPARLGDLPVPPSRLYLVGDVPRGASVAVVGTRTPTREGHDFAFALGRELARRGVAVLSGGAAGIDTAVHEGALAGDGFTLVVAASGFAEPYPEENAGLFARVVAAGGGYLSLHPSEVPAERRFFFARNGCLAAIAHALVVVETRLRGGARNAAKWARRLGRPLLVVPSAPWIPAGAGCLHELRLGAELCTGVADVLGALRRTMALPPAFAPERVEPPAMEEQIPQTELPFDLLDESRLPKLAPAALGVLRAVRAGARHLDDVCDLSGLPLPEVQRHVLTLTLEGVLVAAPVGTLALAPAGKPVSGRKHRK